MTREFLSKIEYIDKEIKNLKKRLKKEEIEEKRIVQDRVKGSNREYPYQKRSYEIEGVKIPKNKKLKYKYRKMIKEKEYKLEKLKIQLEYELNNIEEAEIREIIRHRYNDGKTWLQVMFAMEYNSEETARIKLKRFLEK